MEVKEEGLEDQECSMGHGEVRQDSKEDGIKKEDMGAREVGEKDNGEMQVGEEKEEKGIRVKETGQREV